MAIGWQPADTVRPALSSPQPLPMTLVDGVALFDTGEDDGRPVWVLLHGLGNSAQYWGAVVDELCGHVRVVAVDIPGFGRSPRPSRFDASSVTSLVDAALTRRGIRSYNVAGHSLGAVLALHLLAMRSRPAGRVVLVSGSLFRAAHLLRHPTAAAFSPRLAFFVLAQFGGALVPLGRRTAHVVVSSAWTRRLALWPFVHRPERLDPARLEVVLRGNRGGGGVLDVLRIGRRFDFEDVARTVSHPVDLLWGAEDHLIGEADLRCARSMLGVERELCLPACGHWPHVENPTAVARFIAQE